MGETINSLIPDEATSVKFVVNSNEKSDVNLGSAFRPDASIYLVVKNDTEVEFHTPADKIMANADCSQMFYQKNQLASIDLTNLDTSNVTNMSYMFFNCESLIELNLDNINTSNVTDMSGMFSGCSGLTSLDLSNFDTSKVTDMAFMFYECTGLTSLDLRSFDFQSSGVNDNLLNIFGNVGNDYSPNPITITITIKNNRVFLTSYIGRGNYEIVYVD
jgi:surface protein